MAVLVAEDREDVRLLDVGERVARGAGAASGTGNLVGKVLRVDPGAVGQDDRALDRVRQLADVAGPRVAQEEARRLRA